MKMFRGLTKLAQDGDVEGVRRMLEAGEPVDVIDNGRFNATPLQVAAGAGHLEIVNVLLAAGANVNHVDNDGFSPVVEAAAARKWAVVKVLAEHGGDFNARDATGRNGRDYLRRCRGKRILAAIEAVLQSRARPGPETAVDR